MAHGIILTILVPFVTPKANCKGKLLSNILRTCCNTDRLIRNVVLHSAVGIDFELCSMLIEDSLRQYRNLPTCFTSPRSRGSSF
jgi:hypothetical protein